MVHIDCWDRATGYDDETSLNSAASFLFGYKLRNAEILNVGYNIQYHEAAKMGQWYPEVSSGNFTIDNAVATFIPANGIIFWDMYGKATHTIADQKQTVTNMTTTEGQKTKKKAFQQWDATAQKVDLYGLVTNRISLQIARGSPLQATQTMIGCKVSDSSATPNTATLPDDVSNDPVTGAFTNLDSWTWNSNTMEKPSRFQMIAQQELIPYMKGTDSYYVQASEHNPIVTGFTALVVGDTNYSNLKTDYYAGTKRTMTWKMVKPTSTRYFEVTASNTLCHSIQPIRNPGEPFTYTANFTCENVSIEIQDYLDDDWYTIKT